MLEPSWRRQTSSPPSSRRRRWTTCSARCAAAAIACSGRRCATARSSTTTSSRAAELPIGWTDRQDGGHLPARAPRRRGALRLRRRAALVEAFLFPPRLRLWRRARGTAVRRSSRRTRSDETPLAFIGVRACELHAIGIQDRVFIGGTLRRPRLRDATPRDAFVVAVNCFEPAGTCFCVSMGDRAAGRARATTSRSPRSSTASTASSSRRAATGGARGARGAARRGAAEDADASRRRRRRRLGRRSAWAGRWTASTCATSSPTTSSIRAGTTSPSAASRVATARSSVPRASARRSRTRPTSPVRRPSAHPRVGHLLLASTTRTSTAAASGRRAARATGSG